MHVKYYEFMMGKKVNIQWIHFISYRNSVLYEAIPYLVIFERCHFINLYSVVNLTVRSFLAFA